MPEDPTHRTLVFSLRFQHEIINDTIAWFTIRFPDAVPHDRGSFGGLNVIIPTCYPFPSPLFGNADLSRCKASTGYSLKVKFNQTTMIFGVTTESVTNAPTQ
jgi:hypothetical protein